MVQKWMWFVERRVEQLYLKLLCNTVLLAVANLVSAHHCRSHSWCLLVGEGIDSRRP